ncbi:2-polyprenyl-6-methoxyphenol hydroxylase-like FAD-dependent oxidoreductase [Embleya sp. AB8]
MPRLAARRDEGENGVGDTGMDTDVVIAGAGPTGLMLACELRLAGVDVVVVERLAERSGESRAGGMHSRTLEVLDQRGVLERFLAVGELTPVGHFSGLWLDFDGFESRHPHPLQLPQSTIERVQEEWAAELGVRVRWSSEVIGIHQDETGVAVELRTAEAAPVTLRARYLVGCDGGRSTVRKLAEIDFPGTPATLTALLGDVQIPDLPEDFIFMRRCPEGHFSAFALEPGWHRVITSEYDHVADRDEGATLEQLRESLIRLAGTDYGMRNPRWISRFGDAARQAARYRQGRVLLAGDAAHIHYAAGGQGLNVGVQDAVNLGWKLASVVRGQAPDRLLDSYHDERHPVGERVLTNTRAQAALARPGAQTEALREVFGALMVSDDVNRYLRGMISALDIRYPIEGKHPLVGRRVPDADLKTSDGAGRVYELLHAARPVLLDLRGSADVAAVARGWADRVDLVEARSEDDHWSVPTLGEFPAPAAVLIRPDGHVAWAVGAGAPDRSGLRTALGTWFGPARRG